MPARRLHVFILTGASRGLGRAIAEQLLEPLQAESAGARQRPLQPPSQIVAQAQTQPPSARPPVPLLLCISRHTDAALAAAFTPRADPTAAGRAASIDLLQQWTCDLADPAPVADRLAAWLTALDAASVESVTLINNAGALAPPRPLADAQAADVVNALRVGLEAPMLLTAAFLRATAAWPAHVARKVLNISSGLGRNAMASQAPYCAAKAGLDHFSRAVALEEARRPNAARIVSLAPGVIDTDMQVQLREADAAGFPDRARFVGLHEGGLLDTPAAAAAKVLRYLARADFGLHPVADVRDTGSAAAPSSGAPSTFAAAPSTLTSTSTSTATSLPVSPPSSRSAPASSSQSSPSSPSSPSSSS